MRLCALLLAHLAWTTAFFQTTASAISTTTYTVTNTDDSGTGSLRQAITNLNLNAQFTDIYRIVFNISISPSTTVPTITPASALPTITGVATQGIVIDGTTQPGSGRVQINGTNAGTPAVDGLRITAGKATVKGLVINRFSGDGIDLSGAGGDIVSGNYIGTNSAGTATSIIFPFPVFYGNGGVGIRISSIPNNRIGGVVAGDGNVISGNSQDGIFIAGGAATGNTITGNFIGTDKTGTLDRGNTGDGIVIGTNNNTVGGVSTARNVISGNGENGIYVLGAASGNLIQGNFIGTNASGAGALANSLDGVRIYNSASGNTIGGATFAEGNVISGNARAGVRLDGSTGAISGTVVQGNSIGANKDGSVLVGNTEDGVVLFNAPNNTIGGAASTLGLAPGNRIAGNRIGITMSGTATGNLVQGNEVRNNSSGGVFVGTSGNTIGVVINAGTGNASGAGNAIFRNTSDGLVIQGGAASGNKVQGNFIGTDAAGAVSQPNTGSGIFLLAPGNTIGGGRTAARNIISANGANGVFISGSDGSGNVVQGNFIGTDAAAGQKLGNTAAGVRIEDAANNVIGVAVDQATNTASGLGNVISGNGGTGVELVQLNTGTSGNKIAGNLIGTDVNGSAPLGNGNSGVFVQGAGNLVGGLATGAGNTISANGGDGVQFSGTTANGNGLQGNFIGTNATGTAIMSGTGQALGNKFFGVRLSNAPDNVIGGTNSGARNVISGNSVGVRVTGKDATDNRVQGNFIGTNALATQPLGNLNEGIFLDNAPGNLFGGSTAGAGNVLSGNATYGIRLLDTDAHDNLVQGNFIGTDLAATMPLGNGAGGVFIRNAAKNVIGGTAAGEGNTIAFNAGNGVVVSENVADTANGDSIRGNRIFGNGALGIDLGDDGVTLNDTDDADPGANRLQNFPVLTSVGTSGGQTTIAGTLDSTPNTAFSLDVYHNAIVDPSGFGEGQLNLGAPTAGSLNVMTDANGHATFLVAFPFAIQPGQAITATATDPNGNTSEFSQAVGFAGFEFSQAQFSAMEKSGVALITVIRGPSGPATVEYFTSGGSAVANEDYLPTFGTLQFADGETSRTFGITLVDNYNQESNKTIGVQLRNASPGAVLGSLISAVLSILDDDLPGEIAFATAASSVSEQGANATITVVRTGSASGVAVNFATANDTAIAGKDYTARSGTLTFQGGETSATFSVPIINNNVPDGSRSLNVSLSNPIGGATLGTQSTAALTITDDEVVAGTVQFAEGGYTVNETAKSVTVTFTRTGGSAAGATVHYETQADTAEAGLDFTAATGTVSFAAGVDVQTIQVPLLNDKLVEGNERFRVALSNATGGAVLGIPAVTVVTILDDENKAGLDSKKGTYSGLTNGDSHATGGLITIVLNKNGTFTGRLRLAAIDHRVRGAFDAAGNFSGAFSRKGASLVLITLAVNLAAGIDEITGTLMFDTANLLLTADRAFFDGKTKKTTLVGAYTFAGEPDPADTGPTFPQGPAYGTVKVTAAGVVRLVGILGDGTKATCGASLSQAGTFPLYLPLYKSRGSNFGLVRFPPPPNASALDASLKWFKSNVPADRYYAGGFSTEIVLRGSTYKKPKAGVRVVAFQDVPSNAKVTIGAGNLNPEPPVAIVTLDASNRILPLLPENLKMSLQLATGLFAGTFTEPVGTKRKFAGALLQQQNIGRGSFKGNAGTGFVDLSTNP